MQQQQQSWMRYVRSWMAETLKRITANICTSSMYSFSMKINCSIRYSVRCIGMIFEEFARGVPHHGGRDQVWHHSFWVSSQRFGRDLRYRVKLRSLWSQDLQTWMDAMDTTLKYGISINANQFEGPDFELFEVCLVCAVLRYMLKVRFRWEEL